MFGGAFDPPHLAHRALAQAAIEQLQLDVLRVLPTGQAWHKSRPLTAASHRLAMSRLAFDGLPQVRLDDREIRRAGPSYTLDTPARAACRRSAGRVLPGDGQGPGRCAADLAPLGGDCPSCYNLCS